MSLFCVFSRAAGDKKHRKRMKNTENTLITEFSVILDSQGFFLPEWFVFLPGWLFSCRNVLVSRQHGCFLAGMAFFLAWAHGCIFDRINYRGKKTVVLLEWIVLLARTTRDGSSVFALGWFLLLGVLIFLAGWPSRDVWCLAGMAPVCRGWARYLRLNSRVHTMWMVISLDGRLPALLTCFYSVKGKKPAWLTLCSWGCPISPQHGTASLSLSLEVS